MTKVPSTAGWRWVTRISIVLGIGALTLTIAAVGIDPLLAHLHAIGPWFAVLLAIEGAATVCEAAAIYLMTRGPGGPAWRQVLVAQFAGRAVNSVTPGANLGEGLKIGLLARGRPRAAMPRTVAAVLYVALVSLGIALIVMAVGSCVTAFVFDLPDGVDIALVAAGALAAAVAGGLVVLVRRGTLGIAVRALRKLRVISTTRYESWRTRLAEIDARLRGDHGEHRRGATALIAASQVLQRAVVWVTVAAAGYTLGLQQFLAIVSAGVALTWISALVPLGVGVAEGGNYALFAMIGAPSSLGVALALARRVNQIVFALLGFAILAADRLAHRGGDDDRGVRIVRPARPTQQLTRPQAAAVAR